MNSSLDQRRKDASKVGNIVFGKLGERSWWRRECAVCARGDLVPFFRAFDESSAAVVWVLGSHQKTARFKLAQHDRDVRRVGPDQLCESAVPRARGR